VEGDIELSDGVGERDVAFNSVRVRGSDGGASYYFPPMVINPARFSGLLLSFCCRSIRAESSYASQRVGWKSPFLDQPELSTMIMQASRTIGIRVLSLKFRFRLCFIRRSKPKI